MAGNSNLQMSKAGKTDEFYTQISLVESEMKHYEKYFKDAIVFCNCDDPEYSNFWLYFQLNFYRLGLKKLVSTHYEVDKPSYKMEIVRNEKLQKNNTAQIGIPDYVKTPLEGDGDFRSQECIEILKEADIIVTNPPFSLFREFITQLIDYEKKFIIVGNQNNITYKEIFHYFQEGLIWTGYNSGHFWFRVPNDYEIKNTDFRMDEDGTKWRRMGNICYFTNLDIEKRHESLLLFKTYNENDYPKYDEYDAIHIKKTEDIPFDYYGLMGVPISFITKYNPAQFELYGIDRYVEDNPHYGHRFTLNGKEQYARILIRRIIEK